MWLGMLLLALAPGEASPGWTPLEGQGPPLLRTEAEVTCEAQSYNSPTLRCWWDALRSATFRVRLRRGEEAPAGCSSRDVAAKRGRALVELEACAPACLWAEETPMEVEVDGQGRSPRIRRSLLWRDVVRPAGPEDLSARQEEATGQVRLRWAPPSSWVRPLSYFPLRFHLLLEYFGNLDKGVHAEVYSDRLEEAVRPPRPHLLLRRARIRCRDALARSAWSPWSSWALPSD